MATVTVVLAVGQVGMVPLLLMVLAARHVATEPAAPRRPCGSLADCLGAALDVIHTRDRYSLFENLWFDAINGTNHRHVVTTSDPSDLPHLVRRAAELFNTHCLIWKIAPGLNVKVFKKDEDKFAMTVVRDVCPPKEGGRTFGVGKRRIMMALLPIMYKLGVITTMLVVLTVITLKGLTIGVVLLMLSFGGVVSKLKSHHGDYAKKDIHIHVHPYPGGKPHHYHDHVDHPWQRNDEGFVFEDEPSTEASTTASWSYLPPFMSYS